MNNEYLETLLKDFGQMLTTETVIGEPFTIGKVTIVPVVGVTFAFGSGGSAKNSDDQPQAGAASAGARLTPIAFLSIHEDGAVNLHHVKTRDNGGTIDRLLEMAPGFIDKINAGIGQVFSKNDKDKKPAREERLLTATSGGALEDDDLPDEVAQALQEAVAEATNAAEEPDSEEPHEVNS